MVDSGINFSSDRKSSVNQLSVSAFVTDSTVILGYWDKKSLIEVQTLSIADSDALSSALGEVNPNEINIVYDSQIFAHSDFDSFDPLKFDKYFSEEILKFKEESANSSYEKLKQQKVFTLNYLPQTVNNVASKLHKKAKVHHASTAMANYSLDKPDNILVMIGAKKMSLMIHKGGFKEFLTYELENGYDFLYYILLAAKNHDLDITKIPVKIGGDIDVSSPLYQTLKAHIYNLHFCGADKYSCSNTKNPIHYYLPLMIARSCA